MVDDIGPGGLDGAGEGRIGKISHRDIDIAGVVSVHGKLGGIGNIDVEDFESEEGDERGAVERELECGADAGPGAGGEGDDTGVERGLYAAKEQDVVAAGEGGSGGSEWIGEYGAGAKSMASRVCAARRATASAPRTLTPSPGTSMST